MIHSFLPIVHINGLVQYVAFCIWLLSLNTVFSEPARSFCIILLPHELKFVLCFYTSLK